jgi:RNase P protein component
MDNNKKLFKNNYDYIIMIRKACQEASFQEMNDSLVSLINEIKVK